jgi:hypothetical protein
LPPISYKGSGIAAVDSSLLGLGQGLQVGTTKISFDKGFVQLSDSLGRQVSMGFFSSLQAIGSKETNIRSFVFRAKTPCTVLIGKAAYEYANLNEWVTYNYISEQEIEITRVATGQNPDVFDWQFFASDDPKFTFTIQRASRDSETEIIFSNAARDQISNPLGLGAGIYAQTSNLRGAKKIKVSLVTNQVGAETGTVDVSLEYFDTASGLWITCLPATDVFGVNIPRNKTLTLDVGDDIQQPAAQGDNSYVANLLPSSPVTIQKTNSVVGVVGQGGFTSIVPQIGTLLPSGDNIFRIKAIVKVSTLTFSLGIIKVFD